MSRGDRLTAAQIGAALEGGWITGTDLGDGMILLRRHSELEQPPRVPEPVAEQAQQRYTEVDCSRAGDPVLAATEVGYAAGLATARVPVPELARAVNDATVFYGTGFLMVSQPPEGALIWRRIDPTGVTLRCICDKPADPPDIPHRPDCPLAGA